MSTTKLTVVERRDSYHHGDLAAALKAVAIELIAARGVEGFSLREAAAAVNVSPSAAYKHYASKTELLAAVTEDSFEELNASLQRAMQGVALRGDAAELAVARVQAVGRAYVRFALEHAARFQAMYGVSELCTHRRSVLAAVQNDGDGADITSPSYLTLRSALDDVRSAGLLAACTRVEAETAVWSAIHGYANLLVAGMAPIPPASELEGRVDRLVQGTIVGLSAPIGTAAGRARVAGPARAGSVGTASHLSRLVIADGGRTLVVRATDVDYIESAGKHAMVHVGKAVHAMPESLSALETQLDPEHFLRVSQVAIVNLDRIKEVKAKTKDGHVLVLTTGASIQMTRGVQVLEQALKFS
jgi:AcrR family transcriptional regulator